MGGGGEMGERGEGGFDSGFVCVWFMRLVCRLCYVGICAKQYAMYVCLGKVTYFWVKRYGW